MTAQPEKRDRPYEIAEESDAKETDTTDVKETHATQAKETDAMDTKETDATDAKETDALTIPLVTSNDLRGQPLSARR